MISAMNNERDPITEWEHAIGRRIGAMAVVCLMAIVVGAMVAPIFGGWVKKLLYEHYALYDDCETRVKDTMPIVWLILWGIAIMAWIFAIACNCT